MTRYLALLVENLTFANIVATIALFVSLGGASYAVVSLPPGSVGTKQLRIGAVTPRTLGFPLGATGITDRKVQELHKSACNSPPPPGEPYPSCAPEPRYTLTPGREVKLAFHSPGEILISVDAELYDQGPTGTSAHIDIGVVLDHNVIANRGSDIVGGQTVELPGEFVTAANAGTHTVGVTAHARYEYREPGDVFVSRVTLIVTALPLVPQ